MSQKKRMMIATSNILAMKYCLLYMADRGYEGSAVSDAGEFLQKLRAGEVDVAVVLGGPLQNYDVLPNAAESCGGDLAGWAAVVQARKEGHIIPAVFVLTSWDPPDLKGFVVIRNISAMTRELGSAVAKALSVVAV